MNWDAISAIAEVVGVIAVVVSLLYVGFQVKQNTRQLRHDNLRQTVRSVLDTNWYYHRDPEAFEAFRNGVESFDKLPPEQKALFHSVLVDLTFYFEVVRKMYRSGLIDRTALDTNLRFVLAVLVTPGGREWWQFAKDTEPMPAEGIAWIDAALERDGASIRPITELQPWFNNAESNRSREA